MGNGPSDDDRRLAQAHARKMQETAKAFKPFVDGNKLDPQQLKALLDQFAPGNDAGDDGIYNQPWLGTDTFYRHTEEYVQPARRAAFKASLERAFPGRKS